MLDGRQDYLDDIVETPLLIIDDLGAERASDYMLEQVFNIVDARYQSGRPLIVTTNVDINELKKPAELKYKRIYDRILQMCFPIEVTGRSKRRKILHDDFARRAEILGLG